MRSTASAGSSHPTVATTRASSTCSARSQTGENAAGRGMLTAIVVRLGEGWPGDGFFNLARRLGPNVPKVSTEWPSSGVPR